MNKTVDWSKVFHDGAECHSVAIGMLDLELLWTYGTDAIEPLADFYEDLAERLRRLSKDQKEEIDSRHRQLSDVDIAARLYVHHLVGAIATRPEVH